MIHTMIQRMQGFYAYRNLFKQLVIRDIKLKYRRSFLGYLWSVLNPLFVMIIMVIVFTTMFKSDIPNFPLYLLCGQILFNYMSEATSSAITSVIDSGGLIKKIYVPKYIFTISRVTSTLITMLLSLIALVLVAIFTKTPVTVKYMLIVVPLLELYVFSMGLGLFLAQAAVFFRDIRYIYSVLLTGWTYLTPIFYPVSLLDGPVKYFVTKLNPMYYYIDQFRCLVMYGTIPDAQSFLYASAAALVLLTLGVWSFRKNQDRFILYI